MCAIGVLAPIARIDPPARAATGGSVTGVVRLRLADGTSAPAADAVVWLSGTPPAGGHPPVEIASENKRFAPHVVAVEPGDAIAFPNKDRIYHNVFSRTPGDEFDLGLYKKGVAKERKFDRPAIVQVYCNIHAQMAATIVVVDGGLYATTDDTGRFELRGAPAGTWPLRAWHERGGAERRDVALHPGEALEVEIVLDASGYRPSEHLNKHGEKYPPVTLDDDRY